MSTPEKSSHWKSLAALLGSEGTPDPDAAVSQDPSTTPVAPPVQEKRPSPPPPPPPPPRREPPRKPPSEKRPTHWGKLANVLGLGGSPAPEEPAPEPESPAKEELRSVEITRVTISTSQTSEAAAMAAAHWDTPERGQDDVIDPLEMTAEPFVDEALDAVDLDSIGPRESEDQQSNDERRRRRRRRRGRGRGRRPDGDAGPPDRSPPAIESHLVADAVADVRPEVDVDFVEGPETPEQEHAERPSEGREDGGRRRRRRRRGRRGPRREGAESTSGNRSESRPNTGDELPSAGNRDDEPPRKRDEASSRHAEDEDFMDDDDSMEDIDQDDQLGDDADEQGDDLHLSHKKIPSWHEAIETVIATNMASRANSPSGGSRNRGRGRRDR